MAKPSFMDYKEGLEVEDVGTELGEASVEDIETDDDFDGGVGDDTDLMGEVDSLEGDKRDEKRRFEEGEKIERPVEDLFEFVDDPGLGDQAIAIGFGAEDSERGAGEEEPEESDVESIDSEGNTRGQELAAKSLQKARQQSKNRDPANLSAVKPGKTQNLDPGPTSEPESQFNLFQTGAEILSKEAKKLLKSSTNQKYYANGQFN